MARLNDESRWRAEEDAHTMARYLEIMADKSRMKAAISMASKKAEELQARADAMKKASGGKTSRRK